MNKELWNLFIFIAVCFMVYLIFRNLNMNYKEGMTTDASGNSITPPADGVAGNAAAYGATIKAGAIKIQDTLLITKYRSDYETVILNLDDLVNNLMLKTALSVDQSNPGTSLTKLVELNHAKTALNNVMKFIDSQ
jgi:hypothetical protein